MAPITPFDRDLLSLRDAAKSLPGKVHFSTIWRWCTRGVGGRKLPVVRVGAILYTSRAALAEFCRGEEPAQQAPQRRTTRQRAAAIAAAERELAAAGI